ASADHERFAAFISAIEQSGAPLAAVWVYGRENDPWNISASNPRAYQLEMILDANARLHVGFFYGGRTNIFLAYYRSSKPPTNVAPAKALCLTNGITFKGIVDVLGPGWRPPSEGIGLVSWSFTGGRTLYVRLPHPPRNGSTPLTTNAFFWRTN